MNGGSTMIWVPHPTEAWTSATVKSIEEASGNIICKLANGAETKVPGPIQKYDTLSSSVELEAEVENLVELSNFNEGIILHHIKKRFFASQIYTSVGNILVAVNPYKQLNIYDTKVMEDVLAATKMRTTTVRPHVYSIGAQALIGMVDDQRDQCVLISGESGAGKTEATKKILQFISTMSKSSGSRGTAISVESQILDSNPILESFGNAKTLRNNNSSRFGKYMEINFDKKNNIKGCSITAYLLEKSRVVYVSKGERNYHAFYMLLAGASKEIRQELYLKPADDFLYTNLGACLEVDRRNDIEEWTEMITAMNNLGFNESFQKSIWSSLAAILHLGNLEFAPSKGTDGGSVVTQPQECIKIANILGIPSPELLERALCYRENVVGTETIIIAVEPKKARDQRDAVAKHIYGKVFERIVSVVNSSLYRGKHGCNIGVLDIFGFEVFKFNSFEQLCINYCNERLQSFFNDVIFEEELKLYTNDGVNCDQVTYQDNLGCVRLIDLKGAGVFAFLDEEILLPKGSDEKFVSKLHQTFDESSNTKSVYYGRNRKEPAEFIVRHFAGDVTYNSSNFMEKNKDAIAPGLLKLVEKSTITFLHPAEDDKATASSSSSSPAKRAPASSRMTLAAKFKLDLDSLLTALKQTKPHFIRCVKPNDQQKFDNFDSMLTLNQLKYSGLFEAIRIRKAGYAVRMPHEQFIQQFRHCMAQKLPADVKNDPVQYCQRLLIYLAPQVDLSISGASSAMGQDSKKRRQSISRRPSSVHFDQQHQGKKEPEAQQSVSQWCVGNTRVYIRSTLYKYHLDLVRQNSVGNIVPIIQKIIRGYLARIRVMELLGMDKVIKENERKAINAERELMGSEDGESRHYENIIKNDKELQNRISEAKKARIKAEYERKIRVLNSAVVLIQKVVRGASDRRMGKLHMCEALFRRAIDSRNFNRLREALSSTSKWGIFSYANHKNIKRARNTYKVAEIGCGLYLMAIVNSLNVIKVYVDRARQLIADIINEAYIANELSEAIVCQNITILKEAIVLAKDQNLKHLPKYKDAVIMLNERLKVRDVLTHLADEVCHCVSIPELLNRHDVLQQLLRQSMNLGLSAESVVIETAKRVRNIENLVSVRNDIRTAFELCSMSRMAAALERRQPFVEIYGEQLMMAEVQAVLSIKRMLKFEKIVDCPTVKPEFSSSSSSADGGEQAEMKDDISASGAKDEFNPNSERDIRLPPFVKQALDNLRSSTSVEMFNHNVERLFVLVPDTSTRKSLIRIYKWIVGHAFWAYPKASGERKGNHHAIGGDSRVLKEDLEMKLLQEEMYSAMDEGGKVISPITGLPVLNHPFNNNRFNFISGTNDIIFDRNKPMNQNISVAKPQGLSSMVSRGVAFTSPTKTDIRAHSKTPDKYKSFASSSSLSSSSHKSASKSSASKK